MDDTSSSREPKRAPRPDPAGLVRALVAVVAGFVVAVVVSVGARARLSALAAPAVTPPSDPKPTGAARDRRVDAVAPAAAPPSAAAKAAPLPSLRLRGDRIEVPRALFAYLSGPGLGEMTASALAEPVPATPAGAAGKLAGFRIVNIRPGSVWQAAGLQDGDVIEALNGRPLSGVAEALTLLGTLRTAPEVAVTVRRGAARLVRTLVVVP